MTAFIIDLILLLNAFIPTPIEAPIRHLGYHGVMCYGPAGVCAGFKPGTILVEQSLDPITKAWVVEHENEHFRRWQARELGFDIGDPADERAADAAACRVVPLIGRC